jgi:hypothetical protein
VNAAPQRHKYGFSLVSVQSQSEFHSCDEIGSTRTCPKMARQVFCSFEASRAMVTRVGESVHGYRWLCIMLFGEGELETCGDVLELRARFWWLSITGSPSKSR